MAYPANSVTKPPRHQWPNQWESRKTVKLAMQYRALENDQSDSVLFVCHLHFTACCSLLVIMMYFSRKVRFSFLAELQTKSLFICIRLMGNIFSSVPNVKVIHFIQVHISSVYEEARSYETQIESTVALTEKNRWALKNI